MESWTVPLESTRTTSSFTLSGLLLPSLSPVFSAGSISVRQLLCDAAAPCKQSVSSVRRRPDNKYSFSAQQHLCAAASPCRHNVPADKASPPRNSVSVKTELLLRAVASLFSSFFVQQILLANTASLRRP
ncbi:pyruvate flavodoxin/ferredoxin oxidoreductase domain protein [Sesbania bispinosa]|nr:pyruvate flavodoxin/ferredoxin oxidoreductase domain protein [Sesbania bispinosa]